MEKKILVHVSALLKDSKNRYLFLQRSKSSSFAPLKFDLPGGRMEWGEHPLETLKRELQEEIGSKANNLVFIGLRVSNVKMHDINYHILMLHYSGEFSGSIKLNLEHRSFKWLTLDDAVNNEEIDSELRGFIRDKVA